MNTKNIFFMFGVLLLTAGCGTNDGQNSSLKIIGGDKVSSDDVIESFTVALVNPSGRSFCTGSLITKMHVLTAAHCLVDYSDDSLYIAFGSVAKLGSFSRERLRSAKAFKVNEKYDIAQMGLEVPVSAPGDIALIELSEAAPEGYRPVPVMRKNNEIKVGEDLVLAGYGLTNIWLRTSGVLNKVTTTLIQVSETAKEITFGESPGRSACMGDSGGPALVKRGTQLALIGVTSRGSSRCDDQGFYTDVREYIGWITESL